MEKRKVKLSVIILSYNTKALLKKCLQSVIQTQIPATEIIVVDNASTDGSVEEIQKSKCKIQSFGKFRIGHSAELSRSHPERSRTDQNDNVKFKIILNKENLGYSKGNNAGINIAGGEYLMILNSDTVIKPGALEKLVKFLDGNGEADIVGPRLLNNDGTPQANCGRFPDLPVVLVMLFKEHWGSKYVRWSPETSRFVDWLMGSAFIAKRFVFEKIGGFDEKLFMYMEEVEWFYRARKAGFKTYFLKDSEVIHLGLGSAKSGRKEPILNIYRGLLHYYRKHKSNLELLILEIMLKFKALTALLIGYLKSDNYLKETYGEALKIY